MSDQGGNHEENGLDALLGHLRDARGFRADHVARDQLVGAIAERMAALALQEYVEYGDHLLVRPEEYRFLLDAVFAGSDAAADRDRWTQIADHILRPLTAGDGEPTVRIWNAGCGTGRETYTIAALLASLAGDQAFVDRIRIYATDIDESNLVRARRGTYPADELATLPAGLIEPYFEPAGAGLTFRTDLRRSVVFGRHDLIRDAAISRVDLIVCRDTLVYLNAEAQAQVIARFHAALLDGGALVIGTAEVPPGLSGLFVPIDKAPGTYRTVGHGDRRAGALVDPATRGDLAGLDLLSIDAFSESPVAQVVMTANGRVALINQAAEYLLGVSSQDIGRPYGELDLLARGADLRRAVERAQREHQLSTVGSVDRVGRGGEARRLEAEVQPLMAPGGRLRGVSLMVYDVTDIWRLHEHLEAANRQLKNAYEELQSTNEELETTNEELQSTVEELETTNEELQSSNEELETMNEELQSTNDELQNINDQLQDSSYQVDSANEFLDSVLTSLRAGVVVVDPDLSVQVWNRRAEDLWGLRREEAVGQHFLNLDIGLPIDQLRPMIRRALADGVEPAEIDVPATNRRGRAVTVHVTVIPLGNGEQPPGAVLLMDEGPATPS